MTPDELVLNLTKRFEFEAAHQLPYHDGKCARLHGHSYVLEVTIRGPIKEDNGDPDSGMVLDFARVKEAVKPLIEFQLDHFSLNEVIDNPTAEHMVWWLIGEIPKALPTRVELVKVRLYETSTAWVEWEGTIRGEFK